MADVWSGCAWCENGFGCYGEYNWYVVTDGEGSLSDVKVVICSVVFSIMPGVVEVLCAMYVGKCGPMCCIVLLCMR